MPTGKVIHPDGPSAQGTLGQVQRIDGTIYPFHNNAGLRFADPVMFDIEPFPLKINGQSLKISVAVLTKENGEVALSKAQWTDKFRNRWIEEWEKCRDGDIHALFIKGETTGLKDLIEYRGIDDLKRRSEVVPMR